MSLDRLLRERGPPVACPEHGLPSLPSPSPTMSNWAQSLDMLDGRADGRVFGFQIPGTPPRLIIVVGAANSRQDRAAKCPSRARQQDPRLPRPCHTQHFICMRPFGAPLCILPFYGEGFRPFLKNRKPKCLYGKKLFESNPAQAPAFPNLHLCI